MEYDGENDARLWEEVDREFEKQFPGVAGDGEDGEEDAEKYEQLSLLLQNELLAPDLLPYRLFDHLKMKIEGKMTKLFDAETDMDPLERSLLEMDCKRWEYELVLLNRTRVQKISRFSAFFLKHRAQEMSLVEHEFAQSYDAMRAAYLDSVCLSHLPRGSNESLDSQAMGGSLGLVQNLFPHPDLNKYVMFRALKDLGGEVFAMGEEDALGKLVLKDTCWTCPFEDIKHHVVAGDVCLM